jgi:hypothetical protein
MSSPYTPIPQETNVGELTAWIPLTTAFSWSSACTGQFRLDGPSLMAFDPGDGLEVDTNVICQAPAVTSKWISSEQLFHPKLVSFELVLFSQACPVTPENPKG